MFGKKKRIIKRVITVLEIQQLLHGDLASIDDMIDLIKRNV
jgi:hypothetical protein